MDRRVFYLGLTRLIRASGRVSSFIFLPLIFVFIYHISFIETGIVLGVAILLMSAIQYYSGILTDRIGRRVFLILIPIPAGLLYISMYFTVLYRLPVMLLIGLFYSTIAINALQYPAIQASIADVTSLKQRLSGYTEIRVMANAGAAIGPILGAILSVYGFQYIFLMAGIATFIEIIILYFNVKETYFPSKIEYLTKNDIKLAYKDRFFILFIIIGIIMAFVLRQRGASLTLYAFDFEGLPILYLAYIYSLNGILVVLLQYPIFKLMNRETRPV
ncbi:MFS transporter [Ferroplasma acidiphilum]|nr:MFS transporter [Ferroplasma acidiphilum]